MGPGGDVAAGGTYHMKTASGAATEQTRDNAVTMMTKHNIPVKQAYCAQKTVITGAFDCAVDGDLVNHNQAGRRDVAERAEIIQCHQTLQMCSHLAGQPLVPPKHVPPECMAKDGTIPLLARLRADGNVQPTRTDDDMPHYDVMVTAPYSVWLHDSTIKPAAPSSIDVSNAVCVTICLRKDARFPRESAESNTCIAEFMGGIAGLLLMRMFGMIIRSPTQHRHFKR